MARVYLSTTLRVAYTVDHPVGLGCDNRHDDVLLVQFFLKVVSEGRPNSPFAPPGHPSLVCDGRWGPQSQAYLDRYLRVLRDPASNRQILKQDGRVDPVHAGKTTGAVSHTVYTILALNASYGGTRGPGALADITTDTLFPPELRPSLKLP